MNLLRLITFRQQQPLWTPANVTTVFWLDATQSSTITISTGVSQWADKKGGGINAIQSNSSAQPSYSSTLFPGNFPGVLFDGVDDYLAISTTAMPPTRNNWLMGALPVATSAGVK